jgi:uncharacterized membrane protein YtjA (UPF0391 family)
MIQASISFFILAILAFFFGAYELAGLSAEIGRVLLVVFLFLAVISFLASLVTGKGPRSLP